MTAIHLVVLTCAIAAFAPRSRRWPSALPIAAIAAAVALALMGGRVSRTAVTVLGAPSITTAALLADLAVRRSFGRTLLAPRERSVMVWFLAATSIAIYPAALGFVTIFDLYRVGFLAATPLILAALGVVLLLRRDHRAAAVVLVALLALDLRLLPSVNVFDYVVDPLGGIAALGWVALCAIRAIAPRLRAPRVVGIEADAARGGGSGLGLSSVRAVAHRHGGTVGVQSQIGVGTVFEIRLPETSSDH